MEGVLEQDEWDGKEAGTGVRAKLMGRCVLRFPGFVLPNIIATAIKKTYKTNRQKRTTKLFSFLFHLQILLLFAVYNQASSTF